jgi:NADH-quinone oxidoreductase subunit J
LAFFGIALLFLQLDAQFVGLAQVLVSVGAVAVLIVFAILLTRSDEAGEGDARSTGSGLLAWMAVLAVLGTIVIALILSPKLLAQSAGPANLTVKKIGSELLSTYVLPLEVVGLLLTAAMIGAAVLALREKGDS